MHLVDITWLQELNEELQACSRGILVNVLRKDFIWNVGNSHNEQVDLGMCYTPFMITSIGQVEFLKIHKY